MKNIKQFLIEYWVPLTIMIGCWILSAIIMYAGVRIA